MARRQSRTDQGGLWSDERSSALPKPSKPQRKANGSRASVPLELSGPREVSVSEWLMYYSHVGLSVAIGDNGKLAFRGRLDCFADRASAEAWLIRHETEIRVCLGAVR